MFGMKEIIQQKENQKEADNTGGKKQYKSVFETKGDGF